MVVPIAFAALAAGGAGDAAAITVGVSQAGFQLGIAPILALAMASITTEYRYGTIKATFHAVPRRGSVLAAKASVAAAAAGALGLVSAFGSLGAAALLAPEADLALDTGADWRNVAGIAAYYAVAAVMAVAVGALVRHTAAALTLLLGMRCSPSRSSRRSPASAPTSTGGSRSTSASSSSSAFRIPPRHPQAHPPHLRRRRCSARGGPSPTTWPSASSSSRSPS
ncbi:hypothetical protein AB0J71_23795 [Nonomuraea sp. NPDC049637]|uniref:hypothetical protein n=1 Tax=Nonomuraea sp. NPDC049637 TaxID=3154356 RepID=UPI003417B43D